MESNSDMIQEIKPIYSGNVSPRSVSRYFLITCLGVTLVFPLFPKSIRRMVSGTGKPTGIYPIDRHVPYYPGRIVIRYQSDGLGKAALPSDSFLHRIGGIGMRPLFSSFRHRETSLAQIFEVALPLSSDPVAVAEQAMQDSRVVWAEPVYVRRLVFIPNDSLYAEQWSFQAIQMEAAWDAFLAQRPDGGDPILIGIVDTGVWFHHPDLKGRIWTNPIEVPANGIDDDGNGFIDDVHGWDFGENDNDPIPQGNPQDRWHGTAVAGVAAAWLNNRIGIASPLFQAHILPVKTCLDDDPDQYIIRGYEGLVYAVDMGAKIINLSFGGAGASNAERDIIQYALSRGALIVASSGNDGKNQTFYPAAYEGVLSVAAVGKDDKRAWFSNCGEWVTLSAPGMNMMAPWFADGYVYLSGTSFASPLTAGVAGLVWQIHPEWPARRVMEQLRVTADPIDDRNLPFTGLLGKGRLNAARALSESWPSLRISGYRMREIGQEHPNGILEPGEQVELTLSLTNWLAPFPGGLLRLGVHPSGSFVRVSPTVIEIPSLQTDETWENENQPIEMAIGLSAKRGEKIRIQVDMEDGRGYSDRDGISLQISPPYVTIGNGHIRLTLSSDGKLGFIDYPDNMTGDGFTLEGEGNLLFEGALMIGTAPDRVSNGARGEDQSVQDKDFKVLPGGDIRLEKPGRYGVEEAIAHFSDSAATAPLYVHIKQYAIVFPDSALRHVVFLVYTVENQTRISIRNSFIGLFLDWDLGDPSINRGGFDSDLGVGYVYDPRTNLYAGIALAGERDVGSYALVHNPREIYNGYTKAEKWSHLSQGLPRDFPGTESDYSQVFSVGPISLEPKKPIQIAFVLVAGHGHEAIRRSVIAAKTRFGTLTDTVSSPPESDGILAFSHYPNPVRQGTRFVYRLPEPSLVHLALYDLTGREVCILFEGEQEAGVHKKEWVPSLQGIPLPNGIYLCRLRTSGGSQTRKILLYR